MTNVKVKVFIMLAIYLVTWYLSFTYKCVHTNCFKLHIFIDEKDNIHKMIPPDKNIQVSITDLQV
jgi:hypothetical protein